MVVVVRAVVVDVVVVVVVVAVVVVVVVVVVVAVLVDVVVVVLTVVVLVVDEIVDARPVNKDPLSSFKQDKQVWNSQHSSKLHDFGIPKLYVKFWWPLFLAMKFTFLFLKLA